jgi:hypothetical protein
MCHNHDKKICDANFFLDLWRSSFVGLAISSTVRNCVLGIAHYIILEIRLFLSQRSKPTQQNVMLSPRCASSVRLLLLILMLRAGVSQVYVTIP